MSLLAHNRRYEIPLLLVLLIAMTNCGGPGSDEIPITTSSGEALEHFLRGRDLAERLRNPEALRHFQRAIKADPEFALAYLYMAGVHPSPKGFFENLELAREHATGISRGELMLIEATEAGVNGDPARQLEIYTELVTLYPNDVRARMRLAGQHFGVQDYDNAAAQFEAVVQMAKDYAPPYNMLGYSYRALGNYEKAAEAFRRYIELNPDDPNPYDSYAELLTRQGKFEDAIDHYRRALKAEPSFGPSRIGIASNLVFLGRYEEAREELAEYFEVAVNSGQQRSALAAAAVTHVDEGNYDRALALVRQRYDIAADNADALAMSRDLGGIAFLQLLSHKPDAAAKTIEEALEILESSNVFERVRRNARDNHIGARALVELERRNLTEAWDLSREYLAVTESSENILRVREAHLLLGRVALAREEFDTAIVHLEQANQELSWSQYHLAVAYEGIGDTARAAQLFQSAATTYELGSMTYAAIRREAERRAAALMQ